MGRLILVISLLAGCDLVFPPGAGPGTDGPPRPDGFTALDGNQVDADSPCPLGMTATDETVDVGAETAIEMNAPTTNFGGSTIVNIGADERSRGLFRFNVRTDLGAPILIELHLDYAKFQNGCGGACASCTGYERAGPMRAHAMDSGWNEDEATWGIARIGDPWTAPGADGITDRSDLFASAEHAVENDTEFAWTTGLADEAWAWVDLGQLSFLVVPTGSPTVGTVMIASTLEGVTNACNPADVPASLHLVFCN